MTLFEYPDAKTTAAVFARSEGPEGIAVRADEQTFMDKPRNFFFAVEAAGGAAAGPAARADALFLVCARRAPGEDAALFRARFAEAALPRLRDALDRPGALALHASRDVTSRYDLTLLAPAAGAGSLARTARELERDGAQLLALRVSAHATALR
jgi:hypothetical protein